jgi:hypothetical protein
MVGVVSPAGTIAGASYASTDALDNKSIVVVMQDKKGGLTSVAKPTDSFSYNVFQASFWRRFMLLAQPLLGAPSPRQEWIIRRRKRRGMGAASVDDYHDFRWWLTLIRAEVHNLLA